QPAAGQRLRDGYLLLVRQVLRHGLHGARCHRPVDLLRRHLPQSSQVRRIRHLLSSVAPGTIGPERTHDGFVVGIATSPAAGLHRLAGLSLWLRLLPQASEGATEYSDNDRYGEGEDP